MNALGPIRRMQVMPRRRDQGVILIIALFILLAITLMATVSMQSLGLGERMAGNFKERQAAFQAAEAALRDGEAAVRSSFTTLQMGDFSPTCGSGLCRSSMADASVTSGFTETDWSSTSTKTWAFGATTGAASLSSVTTQPRYAVELRGITDFDRSSKPCTAIFLITAQAKGGNNSTVTLQSTYRFRAPECYEPP